MVNPIPDKVKSCFGELTPAQQVILRGYIGTLRAELKEKEREVLALKDDDPNAHYHGDKKCTVDQYVKNIILFFYCVLLCCVVYRFLFISYCIICCFFDFGWLIVDC